VETSSSIPEDQFERTNRVPAMSVVLLAAVLLGLAYNSASPLGVHEGQIAAVPAASAHTVPRIGYYNETLSLVVEGATSPQPGAGSAVPAANGIQIPSLTWPDVKALLAKNQIVLVDARATQYFQAGAIPGAVSLPGPTFDAAIAAFKASYVPNTALVIYCSSPQCPLSHNVAEALITRQGYTNVRIMPGGYQEYTAAEAGKTAAAK
jgi:rhodanese-related sulfurtransferase